MVKDKKPWYKMWWAIVLYVFVGFIILGNILQSLEKSSQSSVEDVEEEKAKETQVGTETTGQEIDEKTTESSIKPIAEQRSCIDECSQPTCDGYDYINCIVGNDGCKDKQSKEKIKGKCEVECLKDSDCSSDQTCSSNKCEEKPEILNALEETKDTIVNYQEKTDKLNECTRLCAGEDYNIPVYKDEWYSTCYQIYYYAGMEALNQQIADCGK